MVKRDVGKSEKKPRQVMLSELSAKYDCKLSVTFGDPSFRRRIEALMIARELKHRPKAGSRK